MARLENPRVCPDDLLGCIARQPCEPGVYPQNAARAVGDHHSVIGRRQGSGLKLKLPGKIFGRFASFAPARLLLWHKLERTVDF